MECPQESVDATTSSAKTNQSRELSSSGDESTPKTRKPYTVTKQREKWSEEEHDKFLEALKLYSRNWRKIEEHIGTKTAVQIRSHAQKFFSKVTRDSAGKSTGSAVDIPPPRPKRRPTHPYPRKLSATTNRGVPILPNVEIYPPLIHSASDQETESPKSVLSSLASEIVGSPVSDVANCSSVSNSSVTGPNLAISASSEQETACLTQPSPVEEENGSSMRGSDSAAAAVASFTSEDKSHMESNHASSLTSFQLFGRTVVVADVLKAPYSADLVSVPKHGKPPPVTDSQAAGDSSAVSRMGSLSGCSCGVLPSFCSLPLEQEIDAAQKTTTPLPCEPSGITQQRKCSLISGSGAANAKRISSDRSDSNNGASSDKKESLQGPRSIFDRPTKGFLPYKRSLAVREVQQQQGRCSAVTSPKSQSSDNQTTGFLPYIKRSLAERVAQQQQQSGIGEGRQHQRTRLCL